MPSPAPASPPAPAPAPGDDTAESAPPAAAGGKPPPGSTSPSPFAEMLTRLFHERSWVSSPAVSPDGQRIAFVVSTIDLDENTTRSRVWLSSPHGAPGPVTAGPNDSQPAWSPDGRSLAFTSRRGEQDKQATLHVMAVTGPGEVRTVGTLAEGFDGPKWSPDGKHLAFISRTRDARYEAKDESWQSPRKVETFFSRLNGEDWTFDRPAHVYVVATDGTGSPRNLTPGPHQFEGLDWLSDSSGVVSAAARHECWDFDLASDLFVVPLNGEIRALTAQTGAYQLPAVSPDGTRVAFIGHDDPLVDPQNSRVGVIAIDGGDVTWVSAGLDRTFAPTAGVREPIWEDNDTLLATAEDRGDTHLYRVAADGSNAPRPVTDGAITVHSFSRGAGVIAMATSTVRHPAELVTLDRPVTSVTTSHSDWEKFAVPCTDGSGEVDAWIMRPPEFDAAQTYPVLLNVHGGPFTQYGESFFDEAQMQAAAGFVVLMSNPRGGSGRDTAWGQAILGAHNPAAPGPGWGSLDVDDVMAVLDHALTTYSFCDGDRVGMLGGSYGGYMATTLAGRFSDRFGAICSERAVNNMLTEDFTSDISTVWKVNLGTDHVADPQSRLDMSPMRYVPDIDTPLLIIHSENDLRCPVNQAEELFVALRILGKDVTFYRFPGENHDLSRSGSPVHRKLRGEIILDFFTERLAPATR